MAKSTLGAVFQGSVASVAAAVILAVPFVLYFGPRAFGRSFGPVQMWFYGTWMAVGLVGSGLLFTRIDRQRGAAMDRTPRDVARSDGSAGRASGRWFG